MLGVCGESWKVRYVGRPWHLPWHVSCDIQRDHVSWSSKVHANGVERRSINPRGVRPSKPAWVPCSLRHFTLPSRWSAYTHHNPSCEQVWAVARCHRESCTFLSCRNHQATNACAPPTVHHMVFLIRHAVFRKLGAIWDCRNNEGVSFSFSWFPKCTYCTGEPCPCFQCKNSVPERKLRNKIK